MWSVLKVYGKPKQKQPVLCLLITSSDQLVTGGSLGGGVRNSRPTSDGRNFWHGGGCMTSSDRGTFVSVGGRWCGWRRGKNNTLTVQRSPDQTEDQKKYVQLNQFGLTSVQYLYNIYLIQISFILYGFYWLNITNFIRFNSLYNVIALVNRPLVR